MEDETKLEEELRSFEDFFRKLGNEELAKPERAILQTFLLWKQASDSARKQLLDTVKAIKQEDERWHGRR